MSNPLPVKPDFLGVGMERAGTSWIYTMLATHPGIWVPPIKELHYFDVLDPEVESYSRRFNKHLISRLRQKAAHFIKVKSRPELYQNSILDYLLWDWRYFTGAGDDAWYQRLFADQFTKGRICGEITPAYSNLSERSIRHILTLNPEMKFILMVRPPAERAWSGLIHQFCHIEKRNYEDISEKEMLDYLKGSYARARSNVPSILKRWKKCVPDKFLFIRSTTDLKENAPGLIADIYRFLGTGSSFTPPEYLLYNRINSYTKKAYKKPEAVEDFLKQTYPDIDLEKEI